MKKTIILLVLIFQISFSQNKVDKMIDSINVEKSDSIKTQIALRIANELKFSDWKRTLHYIQLSEEITKDIDNEKVEADNNFDIGNIYFDKNAQDISLDYYLKSYEYYKKHNELDRKYDLENNIAIVYAIYNNKDKALLYFNDLLKHYTLKKQNLQVGKTLNNIGNLYYNNNILDKAMYYYKKAQEVSKPLKEKKLNVFIYNNIARCYTQQKKYPEAKKYFNELLKLSDSITDHNSKAWVFNSVSNLFLAQNQADSALYYSKKAKESLIDIYNLEGKNAYENLYKSNILKENYSESAKYFELYDAIQDSLNNGERITNIEKLKLQQQYKENQELQLLKETKRKSKLYLAGLCVILLIFSLIILLLRYKNKLIKSKLENELSLIKKKELDADLENKNKELVTISMMEIQRTEIINGIKDNLKQLRFESQKSESQKTINYILKQLEEEKSNNNAWNEFEMYYGKVNESFYKILNIKHPELTYRDKRLCALLKLNLGTKEISNITGLSLKSIENSRTRLRKKLNLTNSKLDLNTYLESLV